MDPLKILIVEDDAVSAMNLEEILLELGYIVSDIAADFTSALKIFATQKPDLVLLDIDLGINSESGIEVGRVLNELSNVPLIFVSGNYIPKIKELAFQIQHEDFLVKPYNAGQIEMTLERTFLKQNKRRIEEVENIEKILFVRGVKHFEKLDLDNFVYAEADGSSCHVFMTVGKITVSTPLSDFLKQINTDIILRIHRSFAVSLDKIIGFQDNKVIVKIDNKEIQISTGKLYKEKLMSRIHKIRSS